MDGSQGSIGPPYSKDIDSPKCHLDQGEKTIKINSGRRNLEAGDWLKGEQRGPSRGRNTGEEVLHECSQVGPGSHPQGQPNTQEKGEITATWVWLLAYSQYLNSSSPQGKIGGHRSCIFSWACKSPAQAVWHYDIIKGVFDPVFTFAHLCSARDCPPHRHTEAASAPMRVVCDHQSFIRSLLALRTPPPCSLQKSSLLQSRLPRGQRSRNDEDSLTHQF